MSINVPDLPQAVQKAMAGEACLGCPAVDRAFQWLLQEGNSALGMREFLLGLVHELTENGFPLLRFFLGVRTLHPQIAAVSFTWSKDQDEVTVTPRTRDVLSMSQYQDSPVRWLYEEGVKMIRRRLTGPWAQIDFPILEEVKAQGATDYAIFALSYGGITSATMSITTDHPDGFHDDQIAAFETIIPLLSLVMEAREAKRRAANLVETYLGHDAGTRVLGGLIERGEGVTIAAAIWYCDLRDFTLMSNKLPRDEVIAMLNDYFEAVTRPVVSRGGEILKFIGDAVLAIFPMKDDMDRDIKCGVALTAAQESLEAMSDLNDLRAGAGKQPLRVGIGLHSGSVTYGNIGTPNRLDFTVIGPAVNLASRISALCRPLDQPLLSSKAFASPCGTRLRSMGTHELRGFDEPQEVFALPED